MASNITSKVVSTTINGKMIRVPINQTPGIFVDAKGELYNLYLNDNSQYKLEAGKFYKIKACTIKYNAENESSISLTRSSKFSDMKPFEYDHTNENQFMDADLVSIPTALSSPAKKRLSVQGVVDQVYPLESRANWKRQDVTVRCPDTDTTIKVKFWNENIKRKLDSLQEGSEVKIKNLKVHHFMANNSKIVSLDATNETTIIQEEEKETKMTLKVDAMRYEGETIFVDDQENKEYLMSVDALTSLGGPDMLWNKIPCQITTTVMRKIIISATYDDTD